MQTTLAFAPTLEDLEEVFFDAPLISIVQPPVEEEAAEPGEP